MSGALRCKPLLTFGARVVCRLYLDATTPAIPRASGPLDPCRYCNRGTHSLLPDLSKQDKLPLSPKHSDLDAWEAELSERFRQQNYPLFKELSPDTDGILETYELVMRCHGWLLKATEPGMAGFPFQEVTRLQLRKLFSDKHFITTDFQKVQDYYLMIQGGQWLKLLNEFVVRDTTHDLLDHSLQMHEVRNVVD
jgi:hypothetical protein